MNTNDAAAESIINATIKLIEDAGGDIRNITARAISAGSGVSLGLINYHFGSKDNLITICCNRMISMTLAGLAPGKTNYAAPDGLTDKERLISFAKQTFEFVYKNYSMVKISVLSDFKDYSPESNSAMTQKGFMLALRGDMPEQKKRHIAFALASVMQTALLAGENAKEITGYSLKTKKQRGRFIEDTVTMLMEGINE